MNENTHNFKIEHDIAFKLEKLNSIDKMIKNKQGSFNNINDTSNIYYNSSAWQHDPKSC